MVGADMGQTRESGSGSRFTRSHLQAGPVWTVQDTLILVNEIAAVEGDCQDALSSYQKWLIIAENCTALEVVRNASQCRRKWESLLADYNVVKDWESSSGVDSYWSLGCERRQENGLPEDFDQELYRAIDEFTKAAEQANTDPECDSEAEAEKVDVFDARTFALSGSKPKRVLHRPSPQKNRASGRKQPGLMEDHEKPVHIVKDMERSIPSKLKENKKTGPKSKKQKLQPTTQRSETNEREQVLLEEEREKPVPVTEDAEQILATKLKENTELIHAILAGVDNNIVQEEISGLRDDETLKTESVVRKADKLSACLADLVKNLQQLCDVVEEC